MNHTCSKCAQPLRRRRPSGMCRVCAARLVMKDPAARAKISAAQRARFASEPETLERARATLAVNRTKRRSKPGSNLTPEIRARSSAVKLAWCPPELRDEYRLLRRHKYTRDEAQEILAREHETKLQRWRRSIGAA